MNWSFPRIETERRESWAVSVISGATVSWDILIMSPDRGAGHLSRASASVRGEDHLAACRRGVNGETRPRTAVEGEDYRQGPTDATSMRAVDVNRSTCPVRPAGAAARVASSGGCPPHGFFRHLRGLKGTGMAAIRPRGRSRR